MGTTGRIGGLGRARLAGVLLALGLGTGGGLVFHLLGLPAAWLSGSAIAVAVAAFAGLPVALPLSIRQIAFVILGTGMGAAVTPDAFARVGGWPLAMVALVLAMVAVTLVSVVIQRRLGDFDGPTALCASVPGALSQVVAAATDAGLEVRKVALAQSLRLLVLVAFLPGFITWLGPPEGSREGAGAHLPPVASLPESALMIAPCAVVGILARRFKVPAGLLLGAFAASALLHGFGVFETRLPAVVMDPAFVLLGSAIGAAFAGFSAATFMTTLKASLVALAAAFAVATAAAVAFAGATGAPFGEILLAFAPGGIEAMITLAFVLGYDVPFVAALQVVRVVVLLFALPLVLSIVMRRSSRHGAAG